jgi:SAM-dependent methyltransferase
MQPARKTLEIPRKINIGSGKAWSPEWLNLDINNYWRPDIVADFNHPFPPEGEVFQTERFGPLTIEKGSFSLVKAHDVLEHIHELTTAMDSVLALLEEGGIFDVIVPHDLSFGAWQDPTHVRAFNERSWLYYTDWFWYLGWTEARFELAKLDLDLSPKGKKMLAAGRPAEEITSTPRAVDQMRVLLRKIPLSELDQKNLAQRRQLDQR